MAWFTKQWGIVSAIFIAVLLIGGAYFLANGSLNAHRADASSTSALLQAIATRDSDNDGLPDWEETLYGTNPHKADTRGLGMTDGEAVAKGLIVPKATTPAQSKTSSVSSQSTSTNPGLPNAPAEGTLTSAFAQNLFELYMSAKQQNGGAPLSQKELHSIAMQAIELLSKSVSVKPDFKTAGSLHISAFGHGTLKSFAVSADTVFRANPRGARFGELDYLKDALSTSTNKTSIASDIKNLNSISNMYKNIASGLSVLPVPKSLAGADLELINALYRIGNVIGDFTRVNSDPFTAIIALKQYPIAVQNLGEAFIGIHKVYAEANVILPPNTPGAMFANFSNVIFPKPKTATKP